MVTKCVETLADIPAKNERTKFYEQFGNCMTHGVHEHSTKRTKIAKLLQFTTSKSGDEQVSLKESVDRIEGRAD